MPGQRIYYVPPRLVGPIAQWSGMDAPERESWLLDHVADLGFNAVWFSPMNLLTATQKDVHGKKQTGSYYAIRDHFRLDPEFSTGSKEKDEDHLRHFCRKAGENGIRVFADLVFNHVASDHPLVAEENTALEDIREKSGGKFELVRGHKDKLIGLSYMEDGKEKTFYLRFRRNDDLSLLIGGPPEDPWTDVAQVNYASPEARRFFIEDDKALFKQVIDWHIDMGFRGFRCDAAYKIPPESWQELVSYAKNRQQDSVFLAETLCHDPAKVERLANATITDAQGKTSPVFDLGMLGHYWWNFEDNWLPEDEHPRLLKMSKYGGAGSPDNHDTQNTVAGNFRHAFNYGSKADEAIARICVRNYAVALLTGNSAYMQMGYEFCNEKQNGVFKDAVSPQDWEKLTRERTQDGHPLDISARIREINALKEALQVENCIVNFREIGKINDGKMVRLHCEYIDADTRQKKAELVIILNKKPERGPVILGDKEMKAMENAGLVRHEPHNKASSTPSFIDDVLIYHTPLPHDPKAAPAAKQSYAGIKKWLRF